MGECHDNVADSETMEITERPCSDVVERDPVTGMVVRQYEKDDESWKFGIKPDIMMIMGL